MRNHRLVRLISAVGIGIAGLGGMGVLVPSLGSGIAGAVSCSAAGSTGLTAAIVATNGQTINGPVPATGCDIGIYVGPGVTPVTISAATVSGANDEGIFAEQTTALTISHSTIQNNAANPNPALLSDGGITLAGVSNSTVDSNTVTGNNAGGVLRGR